MSLSCLYKRNFIVGINNREKKILFNYFWNVGIVSVKFVYLVCKYEYH